MEYSELNRLLRRQIKKSEIPKEILEKYPLFFKAVNNAYRSHDKDLAQLENILELNSKELYLANRVLEEENKFVTTKALRAKVKLDKVMANVRDVIYEVDCFGNFTYLNSAWIDYSEISVEESIGRNFMEFSDGIVHFDQEVLQQIQEEDFQEILTVFSRYNKSGVLRWWEMSIKLLKTPAGEITGAIGSLGDVTRMKNSEYALKKANKAKSRFLSTMSHEIRTPLNAVIAISNILLVDDPKPGQVDNLNALKFSSKHLLNLINDILDYNKLVGGYLTFDKSPFNLRQIITGTINSFSYIANDKELELKSQVSPALPDGVKGDSLRLSQVLTNLIGNAVKFTKEGKVELIVEKVAENSEEITVRFKIMDTGIGIPENKLKHIFDRFTQADNSTSKLFGGTGLGLAICKRILNLQGSEIYVSSEVGKGTTFWFDLNFGKLQKIELTQIDPEQDTKFDLMRAKILIVDDNEMNLIVLSQILEKWNVDYETAVNGREAFSLASSNCYDAILMDLMMPVMDGYESVRNIRELESPASKVPIIALSASVSNEVIERVGEAGMDDYLSKPFDPVDLYRKLLKYCSKKSMVVDNFVKK